MEKESNQIEKCCGTMMKSGAPIMEKMMQHMQEFMGQESKEDRKEQKSSSLSDKERELILIGASIAAGCQPCTAYHVKKSTEIGLLDIEIKKAIEDSYEISLKASEIMRNHGLRQLSSEEKISDSKTDLGEITRDGELVSIAASLAVNSTSSL